MSARLSGRTLRHPADLEAAGLIPDAAAIEAVARRYAIALSPPLAGLIDPGDPQDPIARQFIPSPAELHITPDERADPIGDHSHEPVPGLIHRYPDRVLLKVTGVCPVYCRFCFRREMVGPEKARNLSAAEIDAALSYVAAHPEIREIILTGGDPFMLSAERAGALTRAIETLEHVDIIRWHTRMPVADPDRIDTPYARAIASETRSVFVVAHVNHPRELTPKAVAALRRMNAEGIILLSQTVLLAGINADFTTLSRLFRALLTARVTPYYLHHPDLAPGTSHFRPTLQAGQALVRELRDRLTGIAQPEYVLDIPGGVSKARLGPPDVIEKDGETWLFGRDGDWHRYPPEG